MNKHYCLTCSFFVVANSNERRQGETRKKSRKAKAWERKRGSDQSKSACSTLRTFYALFLYDVTLYRDILYQNGSDRYYELLYSFILRQASSRAKNEEGRATFFKNPAPRSKME